MRVPKTPMFREWAEHSCTRVIRKHHLEVELPLALRNLLLACDTTGDAKVARARSEYKRVMDIITLLKGNGETDEGSDSEAAGD